MHEIIEPTKWEILKVERLWNRMTFEINLMTTRTSWLVSAQGILFAAFFVSIYSYEELNLEHSFILAIIPIAGMLMCFIMFLYVKAATTIVKVCRQDLAIIKQRHPIFLSDHIDNLNSIEHAQVGRWIRVATLSNYALIFVFALFWVYVPIVLVIAE